MKPIYAFFATAMLVLAVSCETNDDTNQNATPQAMTEVPKTAIPDAVFEEFLVNNNLDDVVDGEVTTSNLVLVTNLILDDLNITDLTGIEDFPNLDNLWLQNTNLTQLDVSQNTLLKFLYFDNNNVSTLDVSDLPLLEKLSFINNNISVVDISSNPNLQILDMEGNAISELNVAANQELFTLRTQGNPLVCITVNEDQVNAIPANWEKDDTQNYSLDCN